MITTTEKEWLKLRDKEYREHSVSAEAKRGIAFQMRAILKSQELTQQELAERSGLTQGAISRALNPNYGNLSINTIVRIAAGFDVAFLGLFVPFSEFLRWRAALPEWDAASIVTFADEETARSTGAESFEPEIVHSEQTESSGTQPPNIWNIDLKPIWMKSKDSLSREASNHESEQTTGAFSYEATS